MKGRRGNRIELSAHLGQQRFDGLRSGAIVLGRLQFRVELLQRRVQFARPRLRLGPRSDLLGLSARRTLAA